MAKLIVTEEEKSTASFLDWDDASLGKAVKKLALKVKESTGGDSVKACAAAVLFITDAIDNDAGFVELTLRGLSDGNKSLGDWAVTVERLKASS